MTTAAESLTPGAGPSAVPPASVALWVELVVQFALIVLVVRLFHLESRSLYHVLLLAGAALPLFLLLPPGARLPGFALLSLAAIGVVLGLAGALWVVGLGAALIGICHLRLPIAARAGLLLAVGAGLGAVRGGWLRLPIEIPAGVWPVLGTMFMFRLISYLYSLRHQDAPVSVTRAVAYFFMLPSVCFPLFPVIDYKEFIRSHFDADRLAISQRGIRWMLRGIVHLLLYRVIYYHARLDPAELRGFGDLVQYLLGTFLLYLRVSGQFHFIVGLLHLFGFHLPETHKLYYLSASILDFWRRINIYWKDFVMKQVYYPCFFFLRRWGPTSALVLASLAVFVATWALHAYQWFWLLGQVLLTPPDILFWSLLAVLVVINSLYERQGARRGPRPGAGWNLGLASRRVATFATICVLWSLWGSESVNDWLGLWSLARRPDGASLLALAGLLVAALAVTGWPWGAVRLAPADARAPRVRRLLGTAALLALTAVAALTPEAGILPGRAAALLATLGDTKLNGADASRMHRGYYEELNNGGRAGNQVWTLTDSRPADWVNIRVTAAAQRREDFFVEELRPGAHITFKRQPFSVNRWGMRDQEYDRAKPGATFRIAVLGPSDVMGTGVGDGETFEAVMEDRLNGGGSGRRFEVLNHAMAGYCMLQQVAVLEQRALAFSPDLVLIVAHATDALQNARHLKTVLDRGYAIPYPWIRELLARAGVRPSQSFTEVRRRLLPFDGEIQRWSFVRLAQLARAAGATPVLVILRMPNTSRTSPVQELEAASAAAIEAIDLTEIFRGREEDYVTAQWDQHPNRLGHRLIAAHLYAELLTRGHLVGYPAPPVRSTHSSATMGER